MTGSNLPLDNIYVVEVITMGAILMLSLLLIVGVIKLK
jgi:hypothetical protein